MADNVEEDVERVGGSAFPVGMLLLHVVCCGGAFLLLAGGGGGLMGLAVIKGSIALLVLGFIVVAVAFAWRAIRRRRATRHPNQQEVHP